MPNIMMIPYRNTTTLPFVQGPKRGKRLYICDIDRVSHSIPTKRAKLHLRSIFVAAVLQARSLFSYEEAIVNYHHHKARQGLPFL